MVSTRKKMKQIKGIEGDGGGSSLDGQGRHLWGDDISEEARMK